MELSTADLDGPVHYADFGGSGPAIVLVHGLGGSHLNWTRVAGELTRHGRVFAPDLVGFGRTPPDRRSSSVLANRALLDRFIAEVAGGEAVLMGNSMGGLISILEAARRPHRVRGLVLVDSALPAVGGHRPDLRYLVRGGLMVAPGFGELFMRSHQARTTPEERVREVLELCCVDARRVPDDVVAAHVELVAERELMPWAIGAHLEAARSLLSALVPAMFHRSARSVAASTLLLHGTEDRLIPVTAARRMAALRPDWTYTELAGVGHAPMLDEPDQFLDAVGSFIASA